VPGFQHASKTSLLHPILANHLDRGEAVIATVMSEINIDAHLVRAPQAALIQRQDDLLRDVRSLAQAGRPNALVIDQLDAGLMPEQRLWCGIWPKLSDPFRGRVRGWGREHAI
jgi:hypothetical protein